MTDTSFTFTVTGRPAPQGSKRHVGGGVMVESCKRLALWRAEARLAASRATPADWQPAAPVRVVAIFAFARPKSHYGRRKGEPYLKPNAPRRCMVRLDVDKLARSLCDAITGPVILDDSQVVLLIAQKIWALHGVETTDATVSMLE